MIKHIVFFRWKETTTEAQIAEIAAGLKGLPALISEIRGFQTGTDVIRSERSYDFALVSDFDDLAALDRYQVHPDHQSVVTKVRAAAASVVAVDYEY